MNNIIFNENINESNFLIYKRKTKIIINEIIPFITDFMKIGYYISKQKIVDNDYDLPTFDGDNKIFTTFSKSIINSFKDQYSLNSDIYNFKNEFFDESKIKNIKINKYPKNVILKNIVVVRKHNQFYIDFYFAVRILINKQLTEEDVVFSCNFGTINKNNGFQVKSDYLNIIKENYTIEKYDESVKIYQDFIDFQNSISIEYNNKIKEFNLNCINGDNKENFINLV